MHGISSTYGDPRHCINRKDTSLDCTVAMDSSNPCYEASNVKLNEA